MLNHHNNRKFVKTICIIITIFLTILIGILMYMDYIQEQERASYYRELNRQQQEQEETEVASLDELEANASFYQKLSDGFDVNILIIGDSIGANAGASDTMLAWTNLVMLHLQKKYDVNVFLTNISMGGNSSYAGYVRTMALADDIDYDLAILCYGQNDGITNFGMYYESIIRAIRNKYKKCSLMSILESSQKEYTEKMMTIQEIAEYYNILVADTIMPFTEGTHGTYDELTNDGVHPNDAGQKLYAETICEIIDREVASYSEFDKVELAPIYENVLNFDNFMWIDVSQFEKIDNTYIYTISEQISGILGIDYTFLSGNNICTIKIDREDFATLEVTFNYDFSRRYIKTVKNEKIDVNDVIEICFDSEEQAAGFKGICFSWRDST